jgi:dTDP-4-amino-4,6-dideoxygalactose transaminase
MGRKLGGREGDLPVTEDVAQRLLRLPMFYGITDDEQRAVAAAISRFCERNGEVLRDEENGEVLATAGGDSEGLLP